MFLSCVTFFDLLCVHTFYSPSKKGIRRGRRGGVEGEVPKDRLSNVHDITEFYFRSLVIVVFGVDPRKILTSQSPGWVWLTQS